MSHKINLENLPNHYVNGEWVSAISNNQFNVQNPATETTIGKIFLGNSKDVDRAVQAAKDAFSAFSMYSKQERLSLLKSLRKVTEKRFDELAYAMTLEMGAPITMSKEAQADAAIGHLDGFINALEKHQEHKKLENGDEIVFEPIGVCGLITPWNWPINQIALKVIPSLATGCTCILKPSEHTPVSAMIYAEIIHEAGYPKGVFNLVHGDGPEVGSALSCHQDIQMMSFTGSTRAGRNVTCDSAETVKRVTLELGGKSPNIVFSDCDLLTRVTESVDECMFNTGQSCDAPTRMLVERNCYEKAVEIAKQASEKVLVDNPLNEGAHIGPLFDKIQFDRVQKMIEIGINEGATLQTGGLGKPDNMNEGWFVKPTVFSDVSNDMQIAQQEIFGPVLVMIPFDSEEDAIKIANDSPYGLAAYIQTDDEQKSRRVASRLRAGAVHINGGAYNYGSPFGGYKQSGNGREGGEMGLEDYLEIKTIHIN